MVRCRWRLHGAALAVALVLALPPGRSPEAKKPAEEQSKRAELRELQTRIESLRKEIAEAEKVRVDIADQLREAESAISDTNRNLRQLGHQQQQAQTELRSLNAEVQRIEARITVQQQQLGKLLYHYYLSGRSDTLRQVLGAEDPNQIARNLHYLKALTRDKNEFIESLRATLLEKNRLAESVRAKSAELTELEQSSRIAREQLMSQREKRRLVLAGIAGEISARRNEVTNLQRDEKRLTRLIEGLARIVQRPPQNTPERPSRPDSPDTAGPGTPQARNEQQLEDRPTGISFERLRGQLRLPARGELLNRFGTQRLEGGATWKGLFIRAASGSEVRAVAPGLVVFADWLRGFGNLIILDHGSSYLSVYGNNESLFKNVGEAVRGGDVIATIGNSGGNPESGLYFEIRHQGQAVDPLKWVNLK